MNLRKRKRDKKFEFFILDLSDERQALWGQGDGSRNTSTTLEVAILRIYIYSLPAYILHTYVYAIILLYKNKDVYLKKSTNTSEKASQHNINACYHASQHKSMILKHCESVTEKHS